MIYKKSIILGLILLLSVGIILGASGNLKQKDIKNNKQVEYQDSFDKKYPEAFDYEDILVDEVELVEHMKTVEHCENKVQDVKCSNKKREKLLTRTCFDDIESCYNQTESVTCSKNKGQAKKSFTLVEHLNGTCTDQVEICYNQTKSVPCENKHVKESCTGLVKVCYNTEELDYVEERVAKTKTMKKKVMKQATKLKYDKMKDKGYECVYPDCDKTCEVPLVNGKCTDYPDSNGDGICQKGESDCEELSLE